MYLFQFEFSVIFFIYFYYFELFDSANLQQTCLKAWDNIQKNVILHLLARTNTERHNAFGTLHLPTSLVIALALGHPFL